ncbi:heterokaryon incompatibility protein-domain-containing protein [Achaetomium macrosporum]|uniref:Heterokaryon incompatibility protein-domain-containing protein n=1 Tax=Achaetomium macrosporum TaxID=79813 RepID=A0AAN7C0X3_9PEZI|nr:heterokaryon incompatibility protein-domain-containing protein [Achaetomium macrosporum]
MRLLNTETFQLESFASHETTSYAILSHTWGKDETLFEDIRIKPPGPLNTGKLGDAKVLGACAKARSRGYRYIWIDTCCIDKSSSAELSEAINSMFEWYRTSQVCYAYLSDITHGDETMLDKSRWFTRGWTLQELIAPCEVLFCSRDWKTLGNRRDLAAQLSDITGIHGAILRRDPGMNVNRLLAETSVAARMSWIRHRQTTRKEDMAYCLMGLFDVNMPLLYGEGTKAYARLQQEIIKNLDDQSILAHWPGTMDGSEGLLARVPPRSQFIATMHPTFSSDRPYF